MPKSAKREPRRRLDAAAARELILDATERRLVVAGPAGIRLQEVARDAGVSHPTVLHHFGSRELLVKAVITRSMHAINAALVSAIQAADLDEKRLEAILGGVADALHESGHGRIVMWLALEGHQLEGADVNLKHVVDAAHALRLSRRKGSKKATREDTAHTVVLGSLALVCSSVLGPTMLANAGLGRGKAVEASFRTFLAKVLFDHIEA